MLRWWTNQFFLSEPGMWCGLSVRHQSSSIMIKIEHCCCSLARCYFALSPPVQCGWKWDLWLVGLDSITIHDGHNNTIYLNSDNPSIVFFFFFTFSVDSRASIQCIEYLHSNEKSPDAFGSFFDGPFLESGNHSNDIRVLRLAEFHWTAVNVKWSCWMIRFKQFQLISHRLPVIIPRTLSEEEFRLKNLTENSHQFLHVFQLLWVLIL